MLDDGCGCSCGCGCCVIKISNQIVKSKSTQPTYFNKSNFLGFFFTRLFMVFVVVVLDTTSIVNFCLNSANCIDKYGYIFAFLKKPSSDAVFLVLYNYYHYYYFYIDCISNNYQTCNFEN